MSCSEGAGSASFQPPGLPLVLPRAGIVIVQTLETLLYLKKKAKTRDRRRGTWAALVPREGFVVCLENIPALC